MDAPKCFARSGNFCKIFSNYSICVYKKKHAENDNVICRFCKPERDVTNGVRYPWKDAEEEE